MDQAFISLKRSGTNPDGFVLFLPQNVRENILKKLVLQESQVYACGIIHHDIAYRNILLSSDSPNVGLEPEPLLIRTDFGQSSLEDFEQFGDLNVRYMSPAIRWSENSRRFHENNCVLGRLGLAALVGRVEGVSNDCSCFVKFTRNLLAI